MGKHMKKHQLKPSSTRSQRAKRKRIQHTSYISVRRACVHPTIEAGWDIKKTLQQNYANLGLSSNPNALSILSDRQKLEKISIDEDMDTLIDEVNDGQDEGPTSTKSLTRIGKKLRKELNEMQTATVPAYQVKSMSVKEQATLSTLIANYANDMEGMAKDIKLNPKQLTVAQLTKRIDLYNRLQSL